MVKDVGVIGAGSWGTALASLLSERYQSMWLWSRRSSVVDSINEQRHHSNFFTDHVLSDVIEATTSLEQACQARLLLLVVPTQFLASCCEQMQSFSLDKSVPLLLCCKGIEQNSLRLPSDIVAHYFPEHLIGVLSGPNFAKEIMESLPAATTIAAESMEQANWLATQCSTDFFRCYGNDDMMGVQVAGALKNVIAIACGITVGRGLGENAKSALVTRAMAEVARVIAAKSGRVETLLGLSGVGDMMLTCHSVQSRNMRFGVALGENMSVNEALDACGGVVEGVATAKAVMQLAESLGLTLPLCQLVYDIIYKDADIDKSIADLLQRPLTTECRF